MTPFEIVTLVLDLFGEYMLAISTAVLVILILRQNRNDRRQRRSATQPAIVVNAETGENDVMIHFTNWGGGTAVDVHALLGDVDDDKPRARMIDLGLMHPHGEHAQSLGPIDGTFGASFKVALYYRDSDDVAHHYDFVLSPRAANAVSIVGEEHHEIKPSRGIGRRIDKR